MHQNRPGPRCAELGTLFKCIALKTFEIPVRWGQNIAVSDRTARIRLKRRRLLHDPDTIAPRSVPPMRGEHDTCVVVSEAGRPENTLWEKGLQIVLCRLHNSPSIRARRKGPGGLFALSCSLSLLYRSNISRLEWENIKLRRRRVSLCGIVTKWRRPSWSRPHQRTSPPTKARRRS